jgi:hypothetical protein
MQVELARSREVIPGNIPVWSLIDLSANSRLAIYSPDLSSEKSVIRIGVSALNQIERMISSGENTDLELQELFSQVLGVVFTEPVPTILSATRIHRTIEGQTNQRLGSVTIEVQPHNRPLPFGNALAISNLDYFPGTRISVRDYVVNLDPAIATQRFLTMQRLPEGKILAQFFTQSGKINSKEKPLESELTYLGFN